MEVEICFEKGLLYKWVSVGNLGRKGQLVLRCNKGRFQCRNGLDNKEKLGHFKKVESNLLLGMKLI